MKTKFFIAVGLALAAFLLGFIPQYSAARRLRSELDLTKQQLAACQFAGKLSGARELLAMSYLEANRKNFGVAREYSSRFFNETRRLSEKAPDENTANILQQVLHSRDTLTADLARGDAAASNLLESMMVQMRGDEQSSGKMDAR